MYSTSTSFKNRNILYPHRCGGVLEQLNKRKVWEPRAFFQRNFLPLRINIQHLRKLLAIYTGIKKFCHFVKDHDLQIYTDYKPLIN